MAKAKKPDLAASAEKYRRAAADYDQHMRFARRWQTAAVEHLALSPGQTVIDVACGTGLNFEALKLSVTQSGQLVGIDASSDMLAHAAERVRLNDWKNVTLIGAPAEEAEIPGVADAALFSFTHDVLQSERAVANVVAHLRPGARVSSVGPKFAPRWAFVVNLVVRRVARPYVTTYQGMSQPWGLLESYCSGGFNAQPMALGGAYLGWGEISAEGVERAKAIRSSLDS